jgi:hypothetical protein
VFIRVPLCNNGQGVNLTNKRMSAWVRIVTAPGTPNFDFGQGHHGQLYSGSSRTGGFSDFSVEPPPLGETGGSSPWYFWQGEIGEAFGSASVTHIGFRLLFNMAFTGTFFIDDIQVTN